MQDREKVPPFHENKYPNILANKKIKIIKFHWYVGGIEDDNRQGCQPRFER